MKTREILENAGGILGCVLAVALFGGMAWSCGSSVYDGFKYRNEPVYLISRMHDPIYRGMSHIPHSVACISPARCEPSGKPSMRYLALLGEHEAREWGLDPAHEIPFTGDQERDLDWN